MFIIAIGATIAAGIQFYTFSSATANLTSKLRTISFKSMLRQDSTLDRSVSWKLKLNVRLLVAFFDEEKHSVRIVSQPNQAKRTWAEPCGRLGR